MLMVQRRTEKGSQEHEKKIKKLEERVRELENALELQRRQEPEDDLYRRRRELVSRLIVEKDNAKDKELWENLPAIERQKIARRVFEERQKDLEDIDVRIEALKSEKGELRER
ncbi:MAG: hypothetical protein KAT65_06945 [Methanophagales archaeon]|nr:hypothetical protein [Methanophagales archaeon]